MDSTLADLSRLREVRADQIITAIRNAANSNFRVSIDTATLLINKTRFSNEQKKQLRAECVRGYNRSVGTDPSAADEYLRAGRLVF